MKNWKISLMSIVFMFILVPFSFAVVPVDPNPNPNCNQGNCSIGGNNGNNVNTAFNNNNNFNQNYQSQGQNQFQSQGQSQDQNMNNRQVIAPNQTMIYNGVRQSLNAPEINPFYLIPLQNGKIVDYTNTLPRFKNPALVKLQPNDVVVKILCVYFGYPWNRITTEEVEEYLLDKAEGYDGSKGNIRFTVKYQDSVITSGMGGGGAVSDTSNSGMTSSTGSILPGATKSTANPIFIITFYEVETLVLPDPPVAEVIEKVVIKEVPGPSKLVNLDYTAFNHDSDELTTEAMEALDKNVEIFKENPELNVSIEGYTSMSGTEKYNQKLSEKRAAAVKDYLVKSGISKDRLSTIGYGESMAIHEPNPNQINSKIAKGNRKVMFVTK